MIAARPPGLDTRGLSETEELEALHLEHLLDDLFLFALDFECAVDLLDVAESMLKNTLSRGGGWAPVVHAQRLPYVPARDAAVTLYQFGRTLTVSIPDALRRCPNVAKKIEHSKLKSVRRRFEEDFKTHVLLRHAVGHAAEMFQTRKKKESQAAVVQKYRGRVILRGNLENRTLIYTVEGKHASVPITRDSLAKLELLATETFDAFKPAYWPDEDHG